MTIVVNYLSHCLHNKEQELKGLQSGADDFVTKPFKLRVLEKRVQNLIDSRRALRSRYSQEVILKAKDIAITPTDELFLEKVQTTQVFLRDTTAISHFPLLLFGGTTLRINHDNGHLAIVESDGSTWLQFRGKLHYHSTFLIDLD